MNGMETGATGDVRSRGLRGWAIDLAPESDSMLHFDMLRFVAATGIVWHHAHEFLVPAAERPELYHRTQALALFVDLFFVISGYVIAFVYAARLSDGASYARFLQRRAGRLIPLHWLTLAVSLAFWTLIAHAGFATEHMPDRSAACMLHTALLLNGLFTCGDGNVLNGVTWSISAEMALYVLFPLLLLVHRLRLIAVLSGVALMMAVMAVHGGRWDEVHPLLRALPSFTFGMTLFLYRDHLPVIHGSWLVIVATTILIALMMTGASQYLVLAMVYLLATAAVATDRARLAPSLVRRAAGLGRLTYGIYMWHMLFVIVLLNAIGDKVLGLRGATMAALILFCYTMVLIWSSLSLHFIETPARRWIDRL